MIEQRRLQELARIGEAGNDGMAAAGAAEAIARGVIVAACQGAKNPCCMEGTQTMLSTQANQSPTTLAAIGSAFTGLAIALILLTVVPSAAISGEVFFSVEPSAVNDAQPGRSHHDPKAQTAELVSQALATLRDSGLSLGAKRQKLRALVADRFDFPTWRVPPSGTIGVSYRRSSVSSS